MKTIVIFSISVFVLSTIFLGAIPNEKEVKQNVIILKGLNKSSELIAVPAYTPIKFKVTVSSDYTQTFEIKHGDTRISGSGRGEGNVIKEGSFTCDGNVEVSIVHTEPNGTTQVNNTRVEDISVYTTNVGYTTVGKWVNSDDGGGVNDKDFDDCVVELRWN